MGDEIEYAVTDGVAIVTINRPEKRNAMSYATLDKFHEAITRAGRESAARAVVITGAGGAFCAGTDLTDLATVAPADRGARGGEPAPSGWPIQQCPKPVVAAVDGPAVGMGAEFTTQCDVRIASTTANFAWNFLHSGLVPDTGAASWLRRLERRIEEHLAHNRQALAACFTSEDHREGVAAFLERREPRFSGR